jgi:hypothetical protein
VLKKDLMSSKVKIKDRVALKKAVCQLVYNAYKRISNAHVHDTGKLDPQTLKTKGEDVVITSGGILSDSEVRFPLPKNLFLGKMSFVCGEALLRGSR